MVAIEVVNDKRNIDSGTITKSIYLYRNYGTCYNMREENILNQFMLALHLTQIFKISKSFIYFI